MIREVELKDKELYISMSEKFYQSDAVLHSIAKENIDKTFELITSKGPYAAGYVCEIKGKAVGYALLAFTYSNEAGGLVLWIEEVYIIPEFQGKGLGKELLSFIEDKYKSKIARIRLEVEESNQGATRLYEKMGLNRLGYIQMYKEINV